MESLVRGVLPLARETRQINELAHGRGAGSRLILWPRVRHGEHVYASSGTAMSILATNAARAAR